MGRAVENIFRFAVRFGINFLVTGNPFTALAMTVAQEYGAKRQRQEARRARDAYNASLQDRLITIESPNGARQRIYGRVRTGGSVRFKGSHGPNKEFLTVLVELAAHEVDAIEEIWIDDKPVTLDGFGNVTTPAWVWNGSPLSVSQAITLTAGSWTGPLPSGWIPSSLGAMQGGLDESNSGGLLTVAEAAGIVTVTGGSGDGAATLMGQQTNSIQVLRVTRYTSSPNLAPYLQGLFGNTLIQSTDTFSGVAMLLIQASYSQDKFPSGLPRITAVVRGARITDPRSNITAWTENPAVIAWD
ncbi:MAG: hypothetical protein ACRCV9_18485, partial [Burkholderiaceae bacterium]